MMGLRHLQKFTKRDHLFFLQFDHFLRKFTFGPLRDLNSSLDHGAEVKRLGATDLGCEVPGRAQQGILGGVDVVGTSVPEYMAPSSAPQILAPTSAPCILAPSTDSKPTAKFPLPRLLSFLPPPSP